MSTAAEVVLKWGDGSYAFALRGRQIEELQAICPGPNEKNSGLGEIADRVFAGRPYWQDIYHTVRLGLIGGGLAPVRAKELVDRYVDGCALAPLGDPSSPLSTATAVLQAAMFGIEDAAGGTGAPGKDEAAPSEQDGSTSRPIEQPSSTKAPRRKPSTE